MQRTPKRRKNKSEHSAAASKKSSKAQSSKTRSASQKTKRIAFTNIDYDMRRDGITQSLASAFLCCPLRGIMKCNRWSHTSKASSTGFGSLCHECLDQSYQYSNKHGKAPDIMQLRKWIDKYKVQDFLPEQEQETNAALAEALLPEYFAYKKYAKDLKRNRFRNTEQEYAVEWEGYLLRAKIDGELTVDKKPWTLEHKTKSRISDDMIMLHLPFDFQNLFYDLIQEVATGRQPIGVLYNVLRKPGLKKKASETLNAYMQRIRADVQIRPEHYFLRYEVIYSQRDRERFRSELLQKLQWIEDLLSGNIHPWRNEFACETPYRCEFLQYCATGSMNGYVQTPKLFMELDVQI